MTNDKPHPCPIVERRNKEIIAEGDLASRQLTEVRENGHVLKEAGRACSGYTRLTYSSWSGSNFTLIIQIVSHLLTDMCPKTLVAWYLEITAAPHASKDASDRTQWSIQGKH